jgi:hypothetical protein
MHSPRNLFSNSEVGLDDGSSKAKKTRVLMTKTQKELLVDFASENPKCWAKADIIHHKAFVLESRALCAK